MSTRIVVGVDGSPGSDAALHWAVAHAPAFGDGSGGGAGVTVVHCWSPPVAGGDVELTGPEAVALERDFAAVLDVAVARAAAEAPEVPLRPVLSRGEPAEVLTGLADGAALLVLGSRGASGHTGLALGSVSRRCADRATCPIVIVPTPG